MTDHETKADALRRAHARRVLGADVEYLLPWHHLQPSEQQRWLREAADTETREA